MNLRQLGYFVAAAEEEHLGRAAQRAHISQPAISHQIQSLEAELEVSLFERRGRGVQLSAAGRVLLEEAQRLFGQLEDIKERCHLAGKGEIGLLRVAINELAGQQQMVAKLFQQYRQRHPSVQLDLLQLTTVEQLEALRAGRIDAGFLYDQGKEDGLLLSHTLRRDEVVLALPQGHALVKKRRVTVDDLAELPMIWLNRNEYTRITGQVWNLLLARGITPRVLIETRSDASMMNFISAGLGPGLVVSTRRWGSLGVAFRRVEGLSLPVRLAMLWQRGNTHPTLLNLVELVRGLVKAG